ncbi:peptidase C14, caspase domain-containing protein [Armillaria borealis]|uniref:Peptidase C14, caspase domain-containing protein n=1 Tax=Armillaria borealis TaxID=47425 RepID=A0AA39IVU1_9AGAR|nr:peptidase C14, caspase domain-containing protein [Armillaria borealis]
MNLSISHPVFRDDVAPVISRLIGLTISTNLVLKMYPLLPGSSHLVDSCRFFAVVIGIDLYGSYPLRGCVSDARLMEKYLTEDLGVPNNHIQLLLGSEEHTSPDDPMNPSRANIISALLSLATNAEIKDGDIIIIYFSGHGSSYSSPDDVAIYGDIETLCPMDRDIIVNNEAIPDISDRELHTILSLIAEHKRSRITVILDCCHGGSIGLPEPGVRTLPQTTHATPQDMLLAGEKNLKDYPGYRSILSKNWSPDMDSHVILTACEDYQFAKEKRVEGKDGGHIGVFTDSLVRVLQSSYITEDTTYVDLINALSTSVYQTPCVYGKSKGTRIWYQD